MTDEKYILALDNGTQSVRAMVFSLDGQLVAKSQIAIEPYVSPQPGWAEQDAEYYWDSLCRACLELWAQLDFPKLAIAAVSLSCQRGTVVNLDRDGKPLRPAIIWLDQRQEHELPNMGAWNLLFTAVGQRAAVRYFQSQSEANWISRRQPEVWQQTHKYLLLSGYHCYRLTGSYVDSVSSQVGYLPFDYKKQQWSGPRAWRWRASPIKWEMLPELVVPGMEMGKISAQAARETGIPEGLPLIAAGSDKACEVLGSGCLTPDIGSLSYGTTATYNVTSERYFEASPPIPAYPAGLPGAHNAEIMIQRGYWMVGWFKQEFGQREKRLAAAQGVAPEVLFDELLKQVPPGSMGLTLQPYWSPGVREPGPEAKGAIIGFGDVHTRAHIYRAIIEGLAYALRAGKESIEKRTSTRIRTLRVSGGGSQSDQAMQITADVFGLNAERVHTYETSGLGAAINAAVGVGLYPDYQAAVAGMVHQGEIFTPVAKNQAIYNQLFNEVYQKMYGRLSPIYRSIREITRYPRFSQDTDG
jgi:sugar (pentulose or hexulose) kinase